MVHRTVTTHPLRCALTSPGGARHQGPIRERSEAGARTAGRAWLLQRGLHPL